MTINSTHGQAETEIAYWEEGNEEQETGDDLLRTVEDIYEQDTDPAEPQRAIQLNPDQEAAVNALVTFLSDPNPASWCFTLAGYAGTGKTFCMREVIARCKGSRIKMAFTAPTNKAAKVLRGITGEAGTIFSLLGLRIDKSGELKKLVVGRGEKVGYIPDLDVIFIDEASMVNSNLFEILEDRCRQAGVKVVFMGDSAQLPPVGEPFSRVWRKKADTNLTKVMRHDNQILTLVTQIREQMEALAPSIDLKSHNNGLEGVWKMQKGAFKEDIYNAACRGEFADGVGAKILAWRNVCVNEYNALARHGIFGAEAQPGFYLPGDRIVAAGPCQRGDITLLNTDDEAIVESVMETKHPMDRRYRALELRCRNELNKVIRLLVLHPESAVAFGNDSEALAHTAKGNGKYWKAFWDHKDLFHDIKYGYALTVHRGQGSTYTNVWVDYQDILRNRNRKEAFQCLYVACSRPTTKLMLA